MSHIDQLEEIDRNQRNQEINNPQQANSHAFANSIVDALNVDPAKVATPLLEQEVIEDEEPPRVNLTAVICTAIVAFCATVILLVAHPWSNGENYTTSQADTQTTTGSQTSMAAKNTTQAPPSAEKESQPTTTAKKQQEPKPENKQQPMDENVKPAASSLPIVKTTKTGTGNIYNDIRLIDASSRLLSKSEVEQMTKEELALARNAIYARHGYQFNNPDLREFFSKQSWFKASDVKIDAIPFTQTELDNIRLIKSQEISKK